MFSNVFKRKKKTRVFEIFEKRKSSKFEKCENSKNAKIEKTRC